MNEDYNLLSLEELLEKKKEIKTAIKNKIKNNTFKAILDSKVSENTYVKECSDTDLFLKKKEKDEETVIIIDAFSLSLTIEVKSFVNGLKSNKKYFNYTNLRTIEYLLERLQDKSFLSKNEADNLKKILISWMSCIKKTSANESFFKDL